MSTQASGATDQGRSAGLQPPSVQSDGTAAIENGAGYRNLLLLTPSL